MRYTTNTESLWSTDECDTEKSNHRTKSDFSSHEPVTAARWGALKTKTINTLLDTKQLLIEINQSNWVWIKLQYQ